MSTFARVAKRISLATAVLFVLAGISRIDAQPLTPESAWPRLDVYASKASVVLEVINTHFTVGRQYKSVFLRVFSDRTAECHHLRYGMEGEKDDEKIKTLTTVEYENLRRDLDNADLLKVKEKYRHVDAVIDSWMTWDIRLPHPQGVQHIAVEDFARAVFVLTPDKPYPDALIRLGCTIRELRLEVFGSEPGEDTKDERRACVEYLK